MPLTPEEVRERRLACTRKWRAANPEAGKASHKSWCVANKERRSAVNKAWRSANRDANSAYFRSWSQANPSRVRAASARRRAAKVSATPPWADRAHLEFIYEHCPKGYHVDHIIPLQGEGFGGLHVPHNLQYLPASVNIAKKNRCVDVSTYAIVPPPWTQPHNNEGHA